MKILLVEDEKQAVLRLQSIIQKIDSEAKIVGICKSIKETIKWFASHEQPNLLFLDIQLSDGISFKIFESITIECPIIFVTAFNNYAIDAFKLHSLDYILKPYSQKDIEVALLKYKKQEQNQSKNISEQVLKELKKILKPVFKTRFFAKINHTVYSIPVQDILYFTFEDQAIVLYRNDLKPFVINHSLDILESYLDPKLFFRINRRFIIHIDSIIKMNIVSKSRIDVVLKNKNKEIVSRSKSKSFRLWLDL